MWLLQMNVLYGINQWKLELVCLKGWDAPGAVQDSTGISWGRCDCALVGNLLGIWLLLSVYCMGKCFISTLFSLANPKAAGMHLPGGPGIKNRRFT